MERFDHMTGEQVSPPTLKEAAADCAAWLEQTAKEVSDKTLQRGLRYRAEVLREAVKNA